MAEEGTFTNNTEVKYKAGSGASATASAEAYTNDFIKQAESEINVATRYNWTDEYSTLNEDVKNILKQAASNLAAIYVIMYDMSGYDSIREAEDLVNVLRDGYLRCLSILRDVKQRDFMVGA